MTTEELKKKIDGLFFGLHSTNPGDINAIKDIAKVILGLDYYDRFPIDLESEDPFHGKVNITDAEFDEISKRAIFPMSTLNVDKPNDIRFGIAATLPTGGVSSLVNGALATNNLPLDSADGYMIFSNSAIIVDGVLDGGYFRVIVKSGGNYYFEDSSI